MKHKPLNFDDAVDFLLYSYFGITMEDMEDPERILKAAVRHAYRDAASHVLSVTDECKEDLRKEASRTITDFAAALAETEVYRLSYEEGREAFDEKHRILCENLVNLYDKKATYKPDAKGRVRRFTCGIAQKWVNMTLKYLYLLYIMCDYWGTECGTWKNYADMLYAFKPFFHVPLDKYMLHALAAPEADGGLGLDRKAFDLPESWSSIENYDAYLNYQRAIRAHAHFPERPESVHCYAPIDWENPAWIAQNRKENELETT